MTSERDAYPVLQVQPDAEQLVVQAAYRALARRYHPDGEAPQPDDAGRHCRPCPDACCGTGCLAVSNAFQALANPDASRRFASARWSGRIGPPLNAR